MRNMYLVPADGEIVESLDDAPQYHGNDGGNGGGGDMLEKRVKQLEDDLTGIKVDIAVIKSNYATSADISSTKVDIANVKAEVSNAKSELHSALRMQAMTIIGSVVAAVGIGVGIIIKFMPTIPH